MLLDKIEELLKEVSALTAKSADDVEQLRLKYLSKKGEINALMGEFRNVAADQKKVVGMKINELKQSAQDKINELKDQLETSEAQSDDIDLTRTAYPINLGTRHPLTLVKNEIIDIFARMGFTLYQGPEIDDDQHVFTMLNFAADHPARDMQDTFFIERSSTMDVTKNVLLRSHTSNDEAHYMSTHEPPIRVLCPGRVYRNEAISARAHCFFHQVEGLYVDKNVSFTDLKQVLSPLLVRCSVLIQRFVFVQATSHLLSQVQRWISAVTSVAVKAVASVSTLDGLRFLVVVWLTHTTLRLVVLIQAYIQVMPSVWVLSVLLTSSTV